MFLAPVIVKCMEKNHDTTKPPALSVHTFHQSYGPSLNRVSTVVKQIPLGKNLDETTELEASFCELEP